MIPQFRAIKSASAEMTKLQDALAKVFNAIQIKQLLDGRLITNIEITSASIKEVEHGFQRDLRGWIVVRKNANANVWESVSNLPKRPLNLNSSANVTISLWVF